MNARFRLVATTVRAGRRPGLAHEKTYIHGESVPLACFLVIRHI